MAHALDAFVTACRLAAFDWTLGSGDADRASRSSVEASIALPAAMQTELRDLEHALEAIERDLMQAAEHQEWSDARNNAIQMRTAASHVARARAALIAARCPPS